MTTTTGSLAPSPLPTDADGLVAVVQASCPTCQLVEPVLGQLRAAGRHLVVYSQDDPAFPAGLAAVDDTSLEASYALDVTTVPTLLQFERGREVRRVEGWLRSAWEDLTGVGDLGAGLPEHRPGCGSRSVEPEAAERLALRFRAPSLRSRRVVLAPLEDEHEACFDRGWTDGLPVVPPTPERVLRMLAGTTRAPDDVVAVVPPMHVPCTVEDVAVASVLAGSRPEYLPVVLAAVEAACNDEFNAHGVLCTTYAVGPVLIVSGPITRALRMNSGMNVLGQGNRANATVGRALQLVIRNVGGGRPGEIDRATFGNPGKLTFCFAEDEEGSPWEPLSVARGFPPGTSTVTVFAGESPRAAVDERSRTPESLCRSLSWALRTVGNARNVRRLDALVVVSPQHGRVFREAGWSRARVREELLGLLRIPAAELVPGLDGCAEGVAGLGPDEVVDKFGPDRLLLAYAGGPAGPTSAVIGGWLAGEGGSRPVTREVRA